MDKDISKALNTDTMFHNQLLDHTKRLVDMSRSFMGRFYDQWDANDKTIRGERIPDKADQKAAQRGEPTKMVLPFSYAQCQTFVAFMMSLFNQRANFFEIQDTGLDGPNPELDAELCLNRDLRKSIFSRVQYQMYLDLCRSSFCVIKHLWEETSIEEVAPAAPAGPEQQSLFGGTVPAPTSSPMTETRFTRQGNKVLAVSPYHFYPDVRLPLSRFQEGEFCASEDEFSIVRLKKMQKDGMIVNVDKIQPLGLEAMQTRRLNYANMSLGDNLKSAVGGEKGAGMCVLTEAQMWITPKDFSDTEGNNPLGTDDYPTLFVIWYANDTFILKAEPINYPHNQFTYDLGEYSPDQVRVVNESLTDMVDQLQQHATWFMNSRVDNVRKVIGDKLVVDPAGIEMKDLQERKPVIRLKTGVAKSGVDTWIKQLQLQDVTTNHIADIEKIWEFIQISTGINDNALGQFSSGRRSAAEARTVNAGAASRLKTIATVLWEMLYAPMGQKLLLNYKNLALDEFKRIVGDDADQARLDAMVAAVGAGMELEFFDGTAPSEKGYIAQSMQELLLGLLENPQAAMMVTQEPFRSLVVEIADLRGIRSPERFLPPPVPTNVMAMPNAPTKPQLPGGPAVGGGPATAPAPAVGTP
jgi:hypothetical protein